MDIDDVLVNVHGDSHVVHGDVHHDCFNKWINPENLRFLSQYIAEIWSFIPVNIPFNIDDALVDVDGDVLVDAHHYGYHGWVSPDNFRFLSQLIAAIWSFICVDIVDVIVDVHCVVHVFYLDAQHDGYDGLVDPENYSFLWQRIAYIWYFITVNVHVDVDGVLVVV